MKHLVLIGLPAVGKTTVGKLLADKLGLEWIDTDAEVAYLEGCHSLEDWYSQPQNSRFSVRETKVLIKALTSKKRKVISTGGGICAKRKNAKAIKDYGFCIFLEASHARLTAQKMNDPKREPTPYRTSVKGVQASNKIYESHADLVLRVNGDAESVANTLIKAMGGGYELISTRT